MYNTIINEVNDSLKTISNIPTIFEENIDGKPSLMNPWIRTTIIPSEPIQISKGDDRLLQYSALMQIDVFTPKGSSSTPQIIDDIIAHFNDKNNRNITDDELQLTALRSWRGSSTQEQNWYKTIIFVRLQWFSN